MFDTPDGFSNYLEGLSKHPGYCAFYDDHLIGAAGVIIPYRGVGEAWAIVLPGARRCAMAFHKAVRRGLQRIVTMNNLHRVEASVLESFTVGRSWAVSLGFVPEGRRRHAGPNKEHILTFAMFPGGS